MTRYGAKLLFEFAIKEAPSSRPLCEKRILVFEAANPREAIRRAKQYGKRDETSYKNGSDQTVRFRFVGLIDVISLESCDAEEAYYSMQRISNPRRHVRPDARLSVLSATARAIESSSLTRPKTFVRTRNTGRRRKT